MDFLKNSQFELTDGLDTLKEKLTKERLAKLNKTAASRTRFLRLVLQDIHHPHNISACLRSADAFGVLDVDVVCLKEKFSPSSVARGVVKWLQIKKWNDIASCADNLHGLGYKIIAGIPKHTAVPLAEISLEKPLALLFGNEHAGVHPDWERNIDEYFTIPMVGMVESLNISVSAAITLFTISSKLQHALGDGYFLSRLEQEKLVEDWVRCHFLR